MKAIEAIKVERTWALVNGGVIENIIVADPDFAEILSEFYDEVPEATGSVAYVGGKYINGEFVPMPEHVPDEHVTDKTEQAKEQ